MSGSSASTARCMGGRLVHPRLTVALLLLGRLAAAVLAAEASWPGPHRALQGAGCTQSCSVRLGAVSYPECSPADCQFNFGVRFGGAAHVKHRVTMKTDEDFKGAPVGEPAAAASAVSVLDLPPGPQFSAAEKQPNGAWSCVASKDPGGTCCRRRGVPGPKRGLSLGSARD